VKIVYTNADIYESYNYHEIIDSQINCESRNKLIIDTINELLEKNRKILVFTKRIEHARRLREIGKFKNSFFLSSTINAKERSELLTKFREEKIDFDVIFGTFSLLATGTDIPRIDSLVFAGDLRSDVLQEQGSGRCLRLLTGKQNPLIIDVVDNKNGILFHQAKERIKWYRKMGWQLDN
jgi:superfamily II DNA or RNA helicase